MLIVKRNIGDRVLIGKDITVSVLNQEEGCVYLGIDAPVSLDILKQELQKHFERDSAEAVNAPFVKKAG
ncbi:MAG TPA: carbon storage regulator [Gammaproteobacteria bacterium]|jgi:carbon storage regulator|nr:carbon storage regulator [Gammaproteobacteria bacterium]